MSDQDALNEVVRYWLEKSTESLAAAKDEMMAGRLSFALNRIYYACFYSVSGYLLQHKLQFRKHSGVRAAFHKNMVKPNLISQDYGKLYDELFEARQRGDYIEMVSFEKEQIEDWLERARILVDSIKELIKL